MSIPCRKRQTDIVGDDNRPRAHVVRPRGRTLCVGSPKGDRPPTSTSPTTWAGDSEKESPTSPAAFGGQHVKPETTSTRPMRTALADWFEAEARSLRDQREHQP